MYLLNENVPIDRKCAYWMKMCLLTKNVHIEWKDTCWRVIILWGINSGSYSFGNLFSTSSLSSFLETQETCGSSSKLLFVIWIFFFFWLNSEKIQESSYTNGSNNNTERFLYTFYKCYSSKIFILFSMPYQYFSSQWQFLVLKYISYVKWWVDTKT